MVNVYDFAGPERGVNAKAIHHGVYDCQNNEGWANVGDTHDTYEFALNTIRK